MNKNILGIKQVADILNVSQSTVRRWADNGTIKSFKHPKSGYRKFEYNDVKIFKDSMKKNVTNDKETFRIIDKNIVPLEHPKHYLMHRYWGRKAHNVVNEYIKCFTNEGDTILDPFMGSGTTIIEGLKLKRNTIGVDLNPMSLFITKNTINDVDLERFSQVFKEIYSKVFNEYGSLYETICPICKKKAKIKIAIWENNSIIKIRSRCEEHNEVITSPTIDDINKITTINHYFNYLNLNNKLNYPKDKILSYVKRSGKENINELFSERALIIISAIKTEILKVKNDNIKNLLLMCFTSMLPNVSKMIPGDVKKCTYKSGWVVSKFWVPAIHTERNVFDCFELRFKTILKGKKELSGLLDTSNARLYNKDSSNLDFIPNESIDYIFTDPPYGESIAYFALSQFWNTWLENDVNYEKEIIIDSYRNKTYETYDTEMCNVFNELYRVLKPNKYLSFTFHNRDLNVWKAILDNCILSGFDLISITMQEQAVSSGTQGLNKKNTLKGDFIYNFRKIEKKEVKPQHCNAEKLILMELYNQIKSNNGATSSELYEYIIPVIAHNRAYYNKQGKVIDIEKLLNDNFVYRNTDKTGESYKWVLKEEL